MKVFLLFLLVFSSLFGAKVVELGKRFQSSQKCKPCHMPIVKDWEHSWHAKSHYENDEYFRASIDYVSRKTRKSLDAVKVECATCHNPRIDVTSTDESYEVSAVMGLNKDSKVKKALKSKVISEGINCLVCHNIDKIHNEYDASKRGINRVEWTPSGTMTGPFADANSPYHKTIQHKFMDKNPNKLCFVCHANDRSVHGLVFTNMQSEYKGGKKCVDCHMGEKVRSVASTLRNFHGKARPRDIRRHTFFGGHVSSFIRGALSLDIKQKGENVVVSIINPQPHNIPSGFGSRELILEIIYKRDLIAINKKVISLTTYYKRKRGKKTIPHLAVEASVNESIPAHGKKVIKLKKIAGATSIEVGLYYRLVNDEVRSILNLKDSIWAKKRFIASDAINLK